MYLSLSLYIYIYTYVYTYTWTFNTIIYIYIYIYIYIHVSGSGRAGGALAELLAEQVSVAEVGFGLALDERGGGLHNLSLSLYIYIYDMIIHIITINIFNIITIIVIISIMMIMVIIIIYMACSTWDGRRRRALGEEGSVRASCKARADILEIPFRPQASCNAYPWILRDASCLDGVVVIRGGGC